MPAGGSSGPHGGGDATRPGRAGKAAPDPVEVDSKAHTGYGNTVHTYSGDTFYKPPPPPPDTTNNVPAAACAISWPTPPILLNARTQECVSLAQTYCTVACVTWGRMNDADTQAKWMGGVSGADENSCDCQLRRALGQGDIVDGHCQPCPSYTYTGVI